LCLGKDIILEGGSLDRSLLAKKAFSTPENTEILNSITHPPIAKKVCEKIDFAVRENYRAALIDAAVCLRAKLLAFVTLLFPS
jgi:dephospho-CoA kinase